MATIILTEWQKELLAHTFGMSVEDVEIHLGPILRELPSDDHCDCPAIPWPDHRHRYVL